MDATWVLTVLFFAGALLANWTEGALRVVGVVVAAGSLVAALVYLVAR